MTHMQSQAQYVLRTVEERGVRFVQLWFTDVLGRHKAFHVTPAELEDALDQGMTFDGSSIDGFSRTQESDVLARPDLTTFQLLPWYEEGAGVARVFCDIVNIDGTPFDGCPRQQLRRVLGEARAQGYTFFVAPEIEFFYFEGLDTTTGTRADRPRQLLRPCPMTRREPTATPNRPDARRDGHRRRARPARRRTGTTRDRSALHRRPHHGRHRDVGAPRGEGTRAPGRRLGELHAQAPRPRAGFGHAHAPLALARRPERVHRRRALRSQ
jgi:glutamine synthetase